jgi:predicted peptidase
MFRRLVLVGFAAMALVVSLAASAAVDLSNSIAGSVSDGTASIPYRLFQPQDTTPGEKVPLVLYLHGMGDRGTDNVSQTYWASQLLDQTRSGQYAAYVLAPQINTNMWFSSSSDTPSEAMSLTMQALKQAMSNPNVDTSRIYVTGVSMGAFGTWDILRRMPGTFAAAVPMSGGGDPSTAAAIKDTPIWAFHGNADNIVSVDTTRNMIAALQAAGGDPKYTEIDGGDHFIWPGVYNDPALYAWMFSQQLGGALDPTIAAAATPDLTAALEPAVSAAVVAVPEPASLAGLLLGGALLLRRHRRR